MALCCGAVCFLASLLGLGRCHGCIGCSTLPVAPGFRPYPSTSTLCVPPCRNLQAMRASPYIKPLEAQAAKWESMLTTLQVGAVCCGAAARCSVLCCRTVWSCGVRCCCVMRL
jgi:hypothetical protein